MLVAEPAGEARKGVLAYTAPQEDPEDPDETGEDGDA